LYSPFSLVLYHSSTLTKLRATVSVSLKNGIPSGTLQKKKRAIS
jgi:hypothetical protein